VKNLKIGHFSHSDSAGGAAIAANRIHQAQREFGIDSRLYVNHAGSHELYTSSPEGMKSKVVARAKSVFWDRYNNLLATELTEVLSLNVIQSSWPKFANDKNLEVINLHWINREFMSVADVARIDIPIFWTLHDLWPLQGIYHYETRNPISSGRSAKNILLKTLDSSLLKRKRKYFKNVNGIIAPSQWIAEIVEQSEMFTNAKIKVIPNPINTSNWSYIESDVARKILNIKGEKVIGYSSLGSSKSLRKGFDLLQGALALLDKSSYDFQLINWGSSDRSQESSSDRKIRSYGVIRDEITLRTLYSACNLLVVPSREDNLPQVAVEAVLSGTPVVCFNVGGLSDIVIHKVNGYLAEPFDVTDLANGIKWVLNTFKDRDESQFIRENAVSRYSSELVASKYLNFYNEVI
jgi:glycosyltransferase involved in cell wall biosynthesis